jgi:NAD-dependent SIR2 family protein deacetylase
LVEVKEMEEKMAALRDVLKKADRVAVLTGAGISAGAVLAEINLESTPHSQFMDFAFHGKAGDIVPRLVEGWA